MTLLDDLDEMVSGSGDTAGLRISAWYRPIGGPQAKVSPPRYATGDATEPYIVEKRFDAGGNAVDVVLLDSIQAQANRAEEALLRLAETERIELPWLQLDSDVGGWHVRLTSLEAPHRSRDAYFRESLLGEQEFEKSPVGLALRHSDIHTLRPYFEHSPADLVFGFWDSQRGGKQTRLARSYVSETIGWEPEMGKRGAGRYDPLVNMGGAASMVSGDRTGWKLDEKGKTRLSEINLGMVPPGAGPGGTSVKSVERVAYLNGVALARLGFASSATELPVAEIDLAARAALAALALIADRAAFAGAGVFLRSGCDLALEREELAFIRRGGEEVAVQVTLDQAVETFEAALSRAKEHGLAWRSGPLLLAPKPNLEALIELAYLRAAPEES